MTPLGKKEVENALRLRRTTDSKRKTRLTMNVDNGCSVGGTWKSMMPTIFKDEIEPKLKKKRIETDERINKGWWCG